MNSKQRSRARMVFFGIIVGAAILLSSIYSISIINGSSYAVKAGAQYSRPASSLFDRGTIYFTDKDGTQTPAATKKDGFLVFMNPKQVTDVSGTYAALANYLTTLDKTSFMAKAAKPNDPYEELVHHVDQTTAQAIQGLHVTGIGVTPETWRSYPGGELAAHEIGLIGEDAASSTVTGKYGLERFYNDVLSRAGTAGSANAFAQIFSSIGSSVFGNDDSQTGDVVTSIEPTVEAYLGDTLAKTAAAWHPDEIGGIIMDPNTGEIEAMDSLPTFDPNNTAATKDISTFSNPLLEHVYEMGSIMKPLTMATALDAGAVQPDSTYDDVGCMVIAKKKICNYDGKARGVIPMQQILSQSLNIGAATIGLKTGATDMIKYFLSYGLGQKSGIDLPNESNPLVDNLKRGNDIDIATASYGQGLAVSAVGMVRALSVIANGGYLVTPHLVKEIDYTDGTVKKVEPARTGPLLKPQTVTNVKNMLITVVDTALANGTIKKDHYTMAAKTGTAEIADHVNGGYYSDRYLHSFFGFFPAYNPRFIIFLYQVWPKGAQYASETLTKPFDDLATFLLNYYNVPPDR